MATWERPRHPADEVERQERQAAEAVLDVVAEDPQEQHVAADGTRLPCRNWLVISVTDSRTPGT